MTGSDRDALRASRRGRGANAASARAAGGWTSQTGSDSAAETSPAGASSARTSLTPGDIRASVAARHSDPAMVIAVRIQTFVVLSVAPSAYRPNGGGS